VIAGLKRFRILPALRLFVLLLVVLGVSVCNQTPSATPDVPGNGGGGGGSGGGDNVLQTEALGFGGTVNGKVVGTQSTRGSTTTNEPGQAVPPDFDTHATRVHFKDLAGNDLRGADGQPLGEVALDSDGAFSAAGLPVGVDFTLCVDIGQDGTCDVESTISIPSTGGAGQGDLSGVQADPLTTLILAKLRQLAESRGVDLADLPISPNAVVARIVAAYTNLFEEAGIDQEITLEDVATLSDEQLAALFDAVMPSVAKAGMAIVEGNLRSARAADAEALAIAAAAIFVQGGFPVADMPGPPDLSSLATLDGVTTTTREAILAELMPHPQTDAPPTPAQIPGGGPPAFNETMYISTAAEADRNFVAADEDSTDSQGGPMLPILQDFVLMEMAQLQLDGRTISLGDLYDLVTSIESGLGVRLIFFVADPNFAGPPMTVFQTADGKGLAVNFDQLQASFLAGGFAEAPPEDLQRRDAELRALMRRLLGGTIPPSFESLYEGIVMDPVPPVDELAQRIRDAKAHLPFSRSGPSAFFVVADGDPFRGDTAVSAVTVNAQLSVDGIVSSAEYVADGSGKYYLGFTERTENEGILQLILRETGRPVQTPRGPVRVSIFDENIFGSVNGVPFAELVSESGVFYPGVNVTVVSTQYVPEPPPPPDVFVPEPPPSPDVFVPEPPPPPDVFVPEPPPPPDVFVPEPPPPPDVVATAQFEPVSPNQQLFVLATAVGAGAEPVRVDYDFNTGTATYNPFGRQLLMFLPDSHETGQFALFNESTGRPAGLNDPLDFFTAPPPPPENFEDFFNEGDGMIQPPPPPPTEPIEDPTLQPPPPDGTVPPPPDEPITPAQLVDGGAPVNVDTSGFILVAADQVVGSPVSVQAFRHVYGTDVPNLRYDANGDPYFDDIDADGVQDDNEPTAPHRPTLFDPRDWRSTDVRLYYRRSDNAASVTFEEIQFDSPTPVTTDGAALVPRNFVPRLNAFRFGRPNTSVNLVTAFAPPEFFDGTHALNRDTRIDIFSAVAIMNLVLDQVFNVAVDVDLDGMGPLPRQTTLTDAHPFTAPIGDPFVLLLKGFRERSSVEGTATKPRR
jgi:hypothetical protein